MIQTNSITEIFPGHYQVILDFPSSSDLIHILDSSYKYVWGIKHQEFLSTWKPYQYTLFGQFIDSKEFYARNMEMEFILDTSSFLDIIPNINQTIQIIQTNILPPHYINLSRLQGKQKYDLLKSKLSYRLEIEIPGATDYSPLTSPDILLLKRIINKLK